MSYAFESLPLYPAESQPKSADYLVYAVVEQVAGNPIRTYWNEIERKFVEKGFFRENGLPVPYGWLPQTLSEADADALDVIILTDSAPGMGEFLVVRPIGVLLRSDADHKILAVDIQDKQFGKVLDYTDLTDSLVAEMSQTFAQFHKLLNWGDTQAARRMIEAAHKYWQTNQPSA